jgi:hypothetical protein
MAALPEPAVICAGGGNAEKGPAGVAVVLYEVVPTDTSCAPGAPGAYSRNSSTDGVLCTVVVTETGAEGTATGAPPSVVKVAVAMF